MDQLVAAAQNADVDAQEELLRRFRPLLLAAIRPVGRLDAGELVQEASYQFLWLLSEYRPHDGVYFERYIKEKLRWRLANVRRVIRRTEAEGDAALATLVTDGPEATDRSVIREALDRLSDRHRSLLIHLYWLEVTPQQLADELGVTARAIRKMRATALRNLGLLLADAYPARIVKSRDARARTAGIERRTA